MTFRPGARGAALGALLLLALALRLAGLEWGMPRCYHPDEWIYSWNAAQMLEHADGLVHSNPIERRYVNPTGFIYATALASAPLDAWENGGTVGGTGCLDRYRAHRADWHLVARALSALLGTVAVWLVARAGRLLEASGAPRGTWILAAGLLALSPLHVRDSHFGTNDVAASALVALGVLALLRYSAGPSRKGAALVGAAIGAAIGTKYNTGLLLLPALATLVAVALERRRARVELALDAGAAGLALLGAFLILSPAPLVDSKAFWLGFEFQASLARQPYPGQEPIPSWLFHARTLALALGPLGLLAAVAGAARIGARRGGLAVTTFPLAHLVVFATMPFAFARVDVPALPPLALLAGAGAASALELLPRRKGATRPLAVLGLVLLLGPPALLSVRIDHLLRERDTRADGEEWLRERLPENPRVVFDPEAYRGCLPLSASGMAEPGLPQPRMRALDDPTLVERYAREGHVRYVALTSGDDDEPLAPGAREFMQTLRAHAVERLRVDAGASGEHVPYSSEERYGPFEHAFDRARPGPPVRVYELAR